MGITKKVFCLDDGNTYLFVARTGYEAMEKMKYTLNLRNNDPAAVINKTESGNCLYMEHTGKTYSIVI